MTSQASHDVTRNVVPRNAKQRGVCMCVFLALEYVAIAYRDSHTKGGGGGGKCIKA